MAEHYIKKDFGVSAEEARRVRKKVQQKYRREGHASAEQYYREYAQEHAERRAKDGPKKDIDKNWHKTLGVSPNASGAEIKAAFRKKAKVSHPDTGGSQEAYLKVQKAWESAQATGKFKRGDSIEMEGFLRRLDASCCKQCEDDEMDVKRKVDALLARLDKKCGNSGIPDGAKCSKGDEPENYIPPEAGSAAPRKKKSGRGKKILKGALIGLGALTAANIAAGTALNVGYGIAASRRKRGYGYDSQDKADALLARLDVKCGKGAISVGEKCHSSAVNNPQP
jgi:hypothetical protein